MSGLRARYAAYKERKREYRAYQDWQIDQYVLWYFSDPTHKEAAPRVDGDAFWEALEVVARIHRENRVAEARTAFEDWKAERVPAPKVSPPPPRTMYQV
jgi:hypothetical protein